MRLNTAKYVKEAYFVTNKIIHKITATMFLEKLKTYGVGRRTLDDKLFADDTPPSRLGVYDLDEENLCHEVIKTTCNIPGCKFTGETLLEFENHYNSCHRYTCSLCKRQIPTPHLLDLHIQETHDSFFAVMAERKPSYCCYIEECKEKFMNADERLEHCVKIHKLPKDFRFEQRQKKSKKPKHKKNNEHNMEIDQPSTAKEHQNFRLTNSKQRGFAKYTGKKFTKNNDIKEKSVEVNMDDIVSDLRTNLEQ